MPEHRSDLVVDHPERRCPVRLRSSRHCLCSTTTTPSWTYIRPTVTSAAGKSCANCATLGGPARRRGRHRSRYRRWTVASEYRCHRVKGIMPSQNRGDLRSAHVMQPICTESEPCAVQPGLQDRFVAEHRRPRFRRPLGGGDDQQQVGDAGRARPHHPCRAGDQVNSPSPVDGPFAACPRPSSVACRCMVLPSPAASRPSRPA